MKKYQLGALTVSDKGLQDTKEEIVIELIDRMQKYVAEGKAEYENGDYTEEQKLNTITNLCGRFCGLAEFLQITMGIDVRRADGLLYTQEMYNHFHYWKMNLEIEIGRERETREVLAVTNFEKLTQSPAEFGAFLRGLPILEGPWDDEFHKRYCRKCSSTDCTYCPHEKFRNNPEWWLNLKV